MIDNVLLKNVGLPHVLDLAVHLVNFLGQITHSCFKVRDGVGWWCWVTHVILVSALGPNPSFFLSWGTLIQLGSLLGQGLGLGLGPGLDNYV